MPGKRFLKVSRAKACRMLLEAVREAAGEDVFVLGAGHEICFDLFRVLKLESQL